MNEEKLSELRERVFKGYMDKTPKSRQMYEKMLAGSYGSGGWTFEPYPLYTTHGSGSKVYDADGNEYIDCQLCHGPLLLGHCHPEVTDAIKREVDRGSLLSYPADLLLEAAELLKEVIPCAEKVKFMNTGTETAIPVARIARAYTGKKKIIKFYGHYHGWDDQFLVATAGNKAVVGSAGIPEEHLVNTVLVKFNDIDAVRRKLDEDNDIAGVILDPQMSRGGWTPSPGYLQELRKLTKERGVLLIFDEIQTAFRLGLGGAQEYFGVIPDLAMLSKSIANGEKLAAVVGKEEFMRTMYGKPGVVGAGGDVVLASGTFTNGTTALAACIATIKAFKRLKKEGAYQKIFQLGSKLKSGIEGAFKERGLPCHVNNLGPTSHVYLTNLEPDYDAYCNLDKRALYLFHLSLITEGVFFTIPHNGLSILSFAHTEEDVQKIIDAVGFSLDKNNFAEVLMNQGDGN